jgi:ankyrin repeat protein
MWLLLYSCTNHQLIDFTRFLLSQLHLDSLKGKKSPKAIRIALKRLPTGSEAYDNAYKAAMERIESQLSDEEELAKQVLSWITCAKRPLTTSELEHALAVEIGQSQLDEQNLCQVEDMVSVCAGLVTIDDESGIIRLVHYTTQEYFERTQKNWFPDAESDITAICITYLSFSVFEEGFCQTDKKFEERLRSNHLYDYAAHNWGYHARNASTLGHEVIHFLECKAKVEASSQALIAVKRYSSHSNYSQEVPRQMIGLHLAAYFGVQEVLNSLLKHAYTLDWKDSNGRASLLWAAEKGHKAAVQLLLDNGADLESKDNDGRTPLSWTAAKGHEAVVQLLLDKGADPESRDNDGQTPLLWAAANGHKAVVQLLLDKGADLESKDDNDRTPLSCAAANGREAVVQLLLDKGADLESKDDNDRTPLLWAARNRHEVVVQLLLDKGADLESKDSDCSRTPLLWAAVNGHASVIELLLDKGADIDVEDKLGWTALQLAAFNRYVQVEQLLILNGASEPEDFYGLQRLFYIE